MSIDIDRTHLHVRSVVVVEFYDFLLTTATRDAKHGKKHAFVSLPQPTEKYNEKESVVLPFQGVHFFLI